MDKLIELLNEYEKEVKKSEIVWSIDNDGDICSQTYEGVDYNEYTEYMNTSKLISKSFGFIKWLVEKDKIDTRDLENYIYFHNDYKFVANRELKDKSSNEIYVDHLLMLLATQDNPIEFLVGILK